MASSEIARIEENIKQLTTGWQEKIEYDKPVKYHQGGCADGTGCACPVVNEKRSKYIRHKPLLEQLREYARHVDLGAEPQAERGSPNKSGSKPPASMAGFHALDEIHIEAYSLTDRVMRESGRSKTFGVDYKKLAAMLDQLPYQCRQIVTDYPHLVGDILAATGKWVDMAKRVLGFKTSEVMFRDTVCGECGGALLVGRDPNKTDVRCGGTPSTPSCGTKYPMSQWLELYEKGRRAK